MSTVKTLHIKSISSDATEELAVHLAHRLKGGELIELAGDLGSGKTTFTRGLARGANSTDRVASPTFTLNKVYKAEHFDIYHFDFYRLTDPGLAIYELHDVLHDPKIVVVTEWAEVVHDVLPEERLTINFSRSGDTNRDLEISYPTALHYLVESLKVEN